MQDLTPITPSNEVPPVQPSITPPVKDHTKLIFGIGLGLVIIAMVGLGIWLLPKVLNRGSTQVSLAASAVPSEAVIFVDFNPHFNQLPNGNVVARAWSDPQVQKSIEDGIRSALGSAQLDWDQDVAPWLGDDIGLAGWNIPFTATQSSGTQPTASVVWSIATRDAAKSNAMFDKLQAQGKLKGAVYNAGTYRGIPTIEQTVLTAKASTAYATVNNLVLIANTLNDLHAAIDAALDKKGLDQSKDYQDTLSKLRGDRALTFYFNIAPYLSLFAAQSPLLNNMTSDEQATLAALQGLALGASFEPNGVRLEFVLVMDPDRLPANQLGVSLTPGNPNKLLRAAPDSTFLYIGARNLSNLFQAMLIGAESADPLIKTELDKLQRQVGVDINDDLASQLNGEFTIVGIPGALGGAGASQIPFGFALIAETKDSKQLEANSNKFFQAIAQNSNSTVADVSIGTSTLHAIKDKSGATNLVYGLLADRFVLASSVDAVQKIDKASSGTSLADNDQFKTATAPLPSSNGGYFYFKPQTIVQLASLGLAVSGQQCTVCDFLTPIKSISSAEESPLAESNVYRAIIFVLLDTGK